MTESPRTVTKWTLCLVESFVAKISRFLIQFGLHHCLNQTPSEYKDGGNRFRKPTNKLVSEP